VASSSFISSTFRRGFIVSFFHFLRLTVGCTLCRRALAWRVGLRRHRRTSVVSGIILLFRGLRNAGFYILKVSCCREQPMWADSQVWNFQRGLSQKHPRILENTNANALQALTNGGKCG
jgi:hypothetical protein